MTSITSLVFGKNGNMVKLNSCWSECLHFLALSSINIYW